MWAHRHAVGIEVHAPAKLNLFLEVLSRRDDGYHDVETLMVPIDLFDTLYFRPKPAARSGEPASIDFTCRQIVEPRGPGARAGGQPPVPEGPDNLVVRAVELLRARAGTQRGADICLVKRIPTAAGLGGGSSDAAATLWAANEAWQLGWSRQDLEQLAAELGSDVPFFLAAGPAVCRGRGERVEPVAGLGDIHAVVVCPSVGLSTADVYRQCQAAKTPCTAAALVAALQQGNISAAAGNVRNRLTDAARELSPWVAEIEEEFSRSDCWAHELSGSGTAYYGLCRHARHARMVAARLIATLRHRGRLRVFPVRRAA